MKPFKGARLPLPKPKKVESVYDKIDAMHADAVAEIEMRSDLALRALGVKSVISYPDGYKLEVLADGYLRIGYFSHPGPGSFVYPHGKELKLATSCHCEDICTKPECRQ